MRLYLSSIFLIFLTLSCGTEGMLTGGKTPITDPENYADFQEGLKEVVKRYNAMSNSMFACTVLGVQDVTTQVVQGVKYTANVRFGPTLCRNTGETLEDDLNRCPAAEDAENRSVIVPVTIWLRPWLEDKNERKIITFGKSQLVDANSYVSY